MRRESAYYGRVELEQKTGPGSSMVECGGGPLLELPANPHYFSELDGAQRVELAESGAEGNPIELDSVQRMELAKCEGNSTGGSSIRSCTG